MSFCLAYSKTKRAKREIDIGITRDESAAEAVKKIAFYSPLSSALASIDSYTRDLLATWFL